MQICIDIHYLIKIASPFRSLHFSNALPINFTRQSPHNDNQFLGNYRSIWRRCRMLIRSCTRRSSQTALSIPMYYLVAALGPRPRHTHRAGERHTAPHRATHTPAANVSSHVNPQITSSHIHKE
ncbi:unnamed protein product [Arctia plantaginis]|uniref:Uncharacterized protein n=1 Tax=Arctia plantaginis TaxID=874455 RepID=A0A8S0ZDJ5_ARCPL|nr:unnamed protein product [Arctia plantaginis]CAB3250039.1 unnamed protein product [Arctia plantaginis]